ncbi:PHP family metal-dependent phosphoesterase [Candidatus Scalindua japonica]|uniref:PHP family metal-dependent phosphoesterase n=1 Tax=Candidatus Scalindua japonica TaxID=1284222 RepID=A0A286U3N0_9BACT|nr:CehA/McbA family metallohydrolase [Candidatus Scalindua japonica]GAX62760.1 PHP family metal-dependent phosphoesterase [Candidatus Scalindua japonica]
MLKDYKGACHIHTEYSDDTSIQIPDVITSAQAAGLDFVILSDHNTFLPKSDGWEGWHDNLLVVIGMEVSPIHDGHFLTLDSKPLADSKYIDIKNYINMPSVECIEEVLVSGGSVYPVHPLGKKKWSFVVNVEAWRNWEHTGFAGIEIWTYMHDWIDDLKLSNLWHFYKNPNLQIKGPDPELLSIWDKLGQERKVVGISGLDAHYREIPIIKKPLFTYEELFKTIRTHILVEHELSKSDDAVRLVCDAHKEGRCYVSFDLLVDATGFSFTAESGGNIYFMGDEVCDVQKELRFYIKSPHYANIKLLRNGKILKELEGDFLEFSSTEKGVYRVEAYIENRPWVFTNPIYIREYSS